MLPMMIKTSYASFSSCSMLNQSAPLFIINRGNFPNGIRTYDMPINNPNDDHAFNSKIRISSKHFQSTLRLAKYSFTHHHYPTKLYIHKTLHNRSIWLVMLLSSFSFTIWYFLYFRNRKLINSFIDFEVKNCLSKLLTKNKTIISIISHIIYNQATMPSTQQIFNDYIKDNILRNSPLMTKIKANLKTNTLTYLQSKESHNQILQFARENIITNPSLYRQLYPFLYDYLSNKERKYYTDLLEMKTLQMLTNDQFKQYLFREIAYETHALLRDPETIKSTIQHYNLTNE